MVATSSGKMQRVLVVSLAATFCYVVATFYFGMRAHSLALISEAGHNVSDMLAIALSFVAVFFQRRPATDQKTFGYQRAGVLAAFVNALTLIVLAAWIAISAIHRLYAPVTVQPRIMMYVAAAGVLMNGAIAALLWKFSGDVNIRSVFLHMLGDTLSTAAVIAGGVGILVSGHDVDRPRPLAPHRRHDRSGPPSPSSARPSTSCSKARPAPSRSPTFAPPSPPSPASSTSTTCTSGRLAQPPTRWPATSPSPEMPLSESFSILDAINCALRDGFHITHTTIQFEIRGCETTHGCSAPPALEAVGHAHHHDHTH